MGVDFIRINKSLIDTKNTNNKYVYQIMFIIERYKNYDHELILTLKHVMESFDINLTKGDNIKQMRSSLKYIIDKKLIEVDKTNDEINKMKIHDSFIVKVLPYSEENKTNVGYVYLNNFEEKQLRLIMENNRSWRDTIFLYLTLKRIAFKDNVTDEYSEVKASIIYLENQAELKNRKAVQTHCDILIEHKLLRVDTLHEKTKEEHLPPVKRKNIYTTIKYKEKFISGRFIDFIPSDEWNENKLKDIRASFRED